MTREGGRYHRDPETGSVVKEEPEETAVAIQDEAAETIVGVEETVPVRRGREANRRSPVDPAESQGQSSGDAAGETQPAPIDQSPPSPADENPS